MANRIIFRPEADADPVKALWWVMAKQLSALRRKLKGPLGTSPNSRMASKCDDHLSDLRHWGNSVIQSSTPSTMIRSSCIVSATCTKDL